MKITKTTCDSANHTRLPKEVLPEWARWDKQGKKSNHVKYIIIYLFIGVLLVTAFRSLVQHWVQTDKEQHVDHQQWDNPDYNDNNNLKN